MPDSFQTVVDTAASLEEAPGLVHHLIGYLSGRGILTGKPNPDGGYPRGPKALSICARSVHPEDREFASDPSSPSFFHLQIVTGRMTHSPSMKEFGPTRAACPGCGRALEDLDAEWHAAAQSWVTGDDDASLACPGCGVSSPVTAWVYDSGYAFGNLAFRFWNWPPLSQGFLKQIEAELGHPVVLVKGTL